jgi:hypothetical protein
MHVDLVTHVAQTLARLHALVADGHLEHGRLRETEAEQAFRFRDDLVRRVAERFHLELRHHFRQFDDRAVDVGDAVPMHERRCGGEALDEAEIERGFDFLEIDGVEIEFHACL